VRRQYTLLRRVKAREAAPWLALDLAPMLGVMLVLLYLLMSPTLMYMDLRPDVADMPHSIHAHSLPGAAREDAIIVLVSRDGRFFLRGKEVNVDDLPSMIREDIGKGAEHRVYITADARAKYFDVEQVVEKVRLAGVKDVDFLTWAEPEKRPR
jgi:biopolymer transport protein TolR